MASTWNFAARLRQVRRWRGWSQVELARRSGVHHMLLSRLETGAKKDVTGTTLRKLALALGVSSDYLLGLAGDPTDYALPTAPEEACDSRRFR